MCSSRLASLRCFLSLFHNIWGSLFCCLVESFLEELHAVLQFQWYISCFIWDSISNGSFVFVSVKRKILVLRNVFSIRAHFFHGLPLYFCFRSLLLINGLCHPVILQWLLLHDTCILGVLFSTYTMGNSLVITLGILSHCKDTWWMYN